MIRQWRQAVEYRRVIARFDAAAEQAPGAWHANAALARGTGQVPEEMLWQMANVRNSTGHMGGLSSLGSAGSTLVNIGLVRALGRLG